MLYTYQDFLKIGESDRERMRFIKTAINRHKETEFYRTALAADSYKRGKNLTIMEFRKMLYTVTGRVIPDTISPNYKMATGKFKRFVTQEVQYLLGNGCTFGEEATPDKLGTKKKTFDRMLQKAADCAITHGVSFGFFNFDHVDVFALTEFVPLYDEENGALMAGIRFWQIDERKPLRATLYEVDGYTEYIWRNSRGEVYRPKTKYIKVFRESQIDGREIYNYENYPAFPIVPMWGNPEHQSKLEGLREQIDCFDLILSGYANNVDEASLIYWTIKNAGGMKDIDLARFVERIKTVHAAAVDDGMEATPTTLNVPVEARERLLDRLERNLYKDARAFDAEHIAAGAVTATQIKAAYNDIDGLCDEFEYCVLDFVNGILEIAGIDDECSFTRNQIVNINETVTTLVQAGEYLPGDYVTRKILTLFGDGDQADDLIKEMSAEETNVANVRTMPEEEEIPEEELNE